MWTFCLCIFRLKCKKWELKWRPWRGMLSIIHVRWPLWFIQPFAHVFSPCRYNDSWIRSINKLESVVSVCSGCQYGNTCNISNKHLPMLRTPFTISFWDLLMKLDWLTSFTFSCISLSVSLREGKKKKFPDMQKTELVWSWVDNIQNIYIQYTSYNWMIGKRTLLSESGRFN